MFVDARSLAPDAHIEADVCIVGAGAAGITLARELRDRAMRVCLLESGGLELDGPTQALYEGEIEGFPYYPLNAIRLRYFGGTTNHWSGVCGPLEPLDFETRPWVPHSGWPISRSDLDPYYERAQVLCQLGPLRYDADAWQSEAAPPLPLDPQRIRSRVNQLSPPTRFGAVYRDELQRAPNVSTHLYGNAVNLETSPDQRRVTRLEGATLEGGRFRVEARLFVLAAGAVENARLLLASNRAQAAGLGNGHDLVGRFFMEHLSIPGALFLPTRGDLPVGLYETREVDGTRVQGFLVPSSQTLRSEELLGVRAFLAPASPRTAMRSLYYGLLRSGTTSDGLAEHVWNLVRQTDDLAIHGYRSFFERGEQVQGFQLLNQLEQAPNPESRVTLGAERDALGMPRPRLAWRFGELERRTLQRANELIGQEVGRAGLGRVALVPDEADADWPPFLRGAWHQMGTTRMHDDPKRGVVDADCRVHGLANLFVAGSSVFPTGGYVNPTLTIVALALRLADHVKRLLA